MPHTKVTALLLQWAHGDESALERLIPLVHQELHRIAQRCMAGERVGNVSRLRRSSTKPTFVWSTERPLNGTTARTFSRCPPA